MAAEAIVEDGAWLAVLMVAFLPAMFFYFQAVKLYWRLFAEVQAGTIEQASCPRLPSWLVAAVGRPIAAIIETVVLIAVAYGLTKSAPRRHVQIGDRQVGVTGCAPDVFL